MSVTVATLVAVRFAVLIALSIAVLAGCGDSGHTSSRSAPSATSSSTTAPSVSTTTTGTSTGATGTSTAKTRTSTSSTPAAPPSPLASTPLPLTVRKKVQKICGRGLRLPAMRPNMSRDQTRAVVDGALGRLTHTAVQVQRAVMGHATPPMIRLALNYRRIGGIYSSFVQSPPRTKPKFNARIGMLNDAFKAARDAAKQARLASCAPRD